MAVAAAAFDPSSDHVVLVVDNVALGQVFSEYVFRFPLPVLIPSADIHSYIILSSTPYSLSILAASLRDKVHLTKVTESV
jgi:hypothetical protein